MWAGTQNTAEAEAKDITAFAASTLTRENQEKDVARTEQLLQLPVTRMMTSLNMEGGEMLQLAGRFSKARCLPGVGVVRALGRHCDAQGHPRCLHSAVPTEH